MLSLRGERCVGRRFRTDPQAGTLLIVYRGHPRHILAPKWTSSSATHSSGVPNKVDRNLRNPGSGGFHDECLAVAFGANRQQRNDGSALDLPFDNTVNV